MEDEDDEYERIKGLLAEEGGEDEEEIDVDVEEQMG